MDEKTLEALDELRRAVGGEDAVLMISHPEERFPCPECGFESHWIECKDCQGKGLVDCFCEGMGGSFTCSNNCLVEHEFSEEDFAMDNVKVPSISVTFPDPDFTQLEKLLNEKIEKGEIRLELAGDLLADRVQPGSFTIDKSRYFVRLEENEQLLKIIIEPKLKPEPDTGHS
ncbi:MAG TPA: hypothetical protein VEF04_15665 [Blastocatellia bacterium]|nr:hypothetical protein [Blastocatellia bacterium]